MTKSKEVPTALPIPHPECGKCGYIHNPFNDCPKGGNEPE